MASLLAPKGVPRRRRRVSNGGLGGCVQTEPQHRYYQDLSLSRKPVVPLRRRRLPPAVNIRLEEQIDTLSTMTPTSVVVHDVSIYGDFGNPFTDNEKTSQLEERIVELLSPVNQAEMVEHSPVFVNRPQTPTTPEQTAILPVELPGSILLPSQGFPQADPPITPARDDYRSRWSEESRRSPTPSLDSSSTTDGEMDIFKNLTSPQKGSVRAKTFSASRMKETSKPFTAMSAEELMQCLPDLNMSLVLHSWVPAMEKELKRIKALLQGAAEVRLQSQANLGIFGTVSLDSHECISPTNFCQDVNSIAVSARDISRTYFDAMQRVRPLADRDAKAINDRLEFTQAELESALATVEENKDIISDKDNLIQRLHGTIEANSRTLGSFIGDHVSSRLPNLRDRRTQEVMQLIDDLPKTAPEDEAHTPARYLRIPENEYDSYLQTLREAQHKVETYSKVTNDQLELIKSQSADLDKRMEGYGECLTILETRHKRIVELESKVETYEGELKVAKENAEAYRMLKDAHEIQGKHCTDLEWTLQSIKNACKKQVEDRDTEIFTLRQQLGDAVMEVAAHKAEERNVNPQPGSSRFRNPLHLGKNVTSHDRNIPINARRALLGGKLPASQSMLSLNTSQANLSKHHNLPSPLSDATTPSVNSSSDQGSASGSISGRWLSGLRMNPPGSSIPRSKTPMIRPRKDSLKATDQSAARRKVVGGEARPGSMLGIDREKALPRPPSAFQQHSQFQSRSQSPNIYLHLHPSPRDTDNERAAHPLPTPPVHATAPQPPALSPHRQRRILSGISERSLEEDTSNAAAVAENPTPKSSSATSTSSSDKNAFRSSMAILERFGDDSAARVGESPVDGEEAGMWRVLRGGVGEGGAEKEYARRVGSGAGTGTGAGGRVVVSPVRGMGEMYHGYGRGRGHGSSRGRGHARMGMSGSERERARVQRGWEMNR